MFHRNDLKFRLMLFSVALAVNFFLNLPSFSNWIVRSAEISTFRADSTICSTAWVQAAKPVGYLELSFGMTPPFFSSTSSVRDHFCPPHFFAFCLDKKATTYLPIVKEEIGYFGSHSSVKSRGPPLKIALI